MKHARRMLVCQIGRGSVLDLLIDDCETLWTAAAGLMQTVDATPTAGGSGYTAGDVLDVTTGGAGGKVQVSTVDGGGAVTAIAHYAGGFGGYTTGAGKATSGGTGTGCTVNITAVRTPTWTRTTSIVHDGAASARVTTSASQSPARSLLGYFAISPGSLSAFAQIKAWIYTAPAAPYDGDELALCLCSDAVGRMVVDEFILPPIPAANVWAEGVVARTGGGTLSAVVQSIALYRLAGAMPGAGFLHLDNIRVSTGLP